MDPFVNPSVQQDSTTDELDESMIYPTYRKRSSEASFMGPSCFRAKDLAPGGSCQTPHPQTAMFLGGPSMVCHPAIDVSKEAFEDHSDSLYLDDSKVSLSSNFSLYSVQNESSNVELRPASPMESDCWRTMSSYVEAQIENTIQWVENYTYSPELIDTVTLPLEDCMCTDEPTATMTAPVEYHAYNHELRNSVTPPSATYRHSFEAIHYMTPAVADHIHTAQYLHPTMPPTGKPSKLSKKRPAIEPPSPSPSTSSRKLRLLELSPLRLHPSTRKTGWVRSPKPTSLGFTDFGYSTCYQEEPSYI